MTKATIKKTGAQHKAAIRLSDPATVERVFELNRDEPFDSGDYLCIGDLVNGLLGYTGMDTFSRDVFMFAFPKAAGRVEKRSGKVAPAGAKAYREQRREGRPRPLPDRATRATPMREITPSPRGHPYPIR